MPDRPARPPRRRCWLPLLLLTLVLAACAPAAPLPPTAAPVAPPGAVAPAASLPAGPRDRDALTVVVPADPEALDPILVASNISATVSRLIFDPLVETDPWSGATEPRLATAWSHEEPTSWVFTIRIDARFQNGDPVTADDVAFSYRRAITDPASRLATSKAVIRDAVALDDRTVRISTRQPYPGFLDQLGRMGITPRRAVEAAGSERFNREPIGAGPFRLTGWTKDDRVELARYDGYWRGAPALARVTLRAVPAATTRAAELTAGTADLAVQLSPDDAARLENEGFGVQRVPTRRTMLLGFNTGTGTAVEGEEPLRDLRVRQAIAYAVDVPALVRDVLDDAGLPIAGTLTPQNFGFDPTLAPVPHDPARARALLAEAGYPDGIEVDFDVPSGRYLRDREVGEAIAGQLTQAGIRTRLLVQEWGAFSAKYQGRKFRGIYLLGIGREYQPDGHLVTYYASAGRGWYFRDAEVDALVGRITASGDPAARTADLAALERRLRAVMPVTFLYQQVEVYAHRPGLRWTGTPDDYLWLDRAGWQPS